MSPDTALQHDIAAARSKTPRFLFRYWNTTSQINTRHAITPSFFQADDTLAKNEQPTYDDTFIASAIHHLESLESSGKNTLFSTWSHSLPYVLSQALAASKPKKKGAKVNKELAFIAVLDTEKCPQNVILHTKTLNELISAAIPVRRWEYLIYGVIQGEAYCAVSWTKIEEHMMKYLRRGNEVLNNAVRDAAPGTARGPQDLIFKHAWELGKLFDAPYRKVVACHIFGMIDWNDKEILHLVAKRSGFSDIPTEWARDLKLLNPDELECHGVPETLRANEILRQLVVLAGNKGGDMTASAAFEQRLEEARTSVSREIFETFAHEKLDDLKALSEYKYMLQYVAEPPTPPPRRPLPDPVKRQFPLSQDFVVDSSDEEGQGDERSEVIVVAMPKMGALRITNPDVEMEVRVVEEDMD